MKKAWWQSKGIWAGILLILLALYEFATGENAMSAAETFFAGLGITGIRHAIPA